MLIQELIDNWTGMPSGKAIDIVSLSAKGYPSWTIKLGAEYGVAIPVCSGEEISEYFAGAHFYTGKILFGETDEYRVLMLTSGKDEIREQFASLCAEFLDPGRDGEQREKLIVEPATWWMQWKELLGNRNVELRVYDVLGELWALKYLAEKNIYAEWNGPDGATYDIDCDTCYVEVKSTVMRNKKQITLSNLFQLDPPNGDKLYLIFCQFETAVSGMSINSLVNDLERLGYSKTVLNTKLETLGFEIGKTARKKCYMIHAATKYVIDDFFPAIRNDSFVGGRLPNGVMGITYTITLDGIPGENLLINGDK